MINGKKTEREISMEKEIEERRIEWEARVINQGLSIKDKGKRKLVKTARIETPYSSIKGDTLDNILHKVKLDLMSDLRLELKSPIVIQIRRVKKVVYDEQHKEK